MKEFYFALVYNKEQFDSAVKEMQNYIEDNPLMGKGDFAQNVLKSVMENSKVANDQLNRFLIENKLSVSTIKRWDEEYTSELPQNFFTQTVDRLN